MNLHQMVNSRQTTRGCAYSWAVWEFSEAAETLAARPCPPFDGPALDAIMPRCGEHQEETIQEGEFGDDGCGFDECDSIVQTSIGSRVARAWDTVSDTCRSLEEQCPNKYFGGTN
jgi:hypothetical protein